MLDPKDRHAAVESRLPGNNWLRISTLAQSPLAIILALAVCLMPGSAAPETGLGHQIEEPLDPAASVTAAHGVPVAYTLASDGFVTLVVETLGGRRVRNLLSAASRKGGKHLEFWDGNDDAGVPVAPDSYRIRGLVRKHLDARYEFSFGAPGDPPWPTEDGTGAWLSNHTNPVSLCSDRQRIYIASTYSEGPHTVIAVDYNGKKVWGALSNAYAGPMTLTDGLLYVVSEETFRAARRADDIDRPVDIFLQRLNPESGEIVTFPDGSTKKKLAEWRPDKVLAGRRPDGEAAQQGFTPDWTGAAVLGIAADESQIYVPIRFADRILRIDAKTGRTIGEIAIKRPGGLAVKGRKLLAVSANQVAQIDLESGANHILVAQGLVAPVAIAAGEDNRVYVSDWAGEMNVKVFDGQGHPQGQIGQAGANMNATDYNPQTMRFPRGITVDASNRIWVAEDSYSPRRISVWNREGQLLKEIVGGLHYGGTGAYVFPDAPNRAWVLGNELELDWSQARWRILSTPWRPRIAGDVIGLAHDVDIGRVISNSHGRYLVSNTRELSGSTVISRFENNGIVPVAASGPVTALLPSIGGNRGGQEPSSLYANRLWSNSRTDALAHKLIPWFFHGPSAGAPQALQTVPGGRPDNNFIWSDSNHNGSVEPDELQFFATPGARGGDTSAWRTSIWARGVTDNELSMYFSARKKAGSEHWRLPVSRWDDAGVPMYTPNKARRIAAASMDVYATWVDKDGHLLAIADQPGKNKDGTTDPITMWTAQGNLAWTYPSPYSSVHASHAAPKGRQGELIGTLGVLGSAELPGVGQIFALGTNMGKAEFFTSDGLYIGSLFTDARMGATVLPKQPVRGMPVSDTSNGGEWFGGQLFQRQDTRDLFILFGRAAGNIARVTGLDSLRRLPDQQVKLTTSEDAANAKFKAAHQASPTLSIRKAAESRLSPEKLERSWPSDFTEWGYDDTHRATASWTWDDQNLYLWFRSVTDPTPMQNRGQSIYQLFKPGDALLFEMDSQPDRTGNKQAADRFRIVLSVFKDQPVAVLYRYDKLKGKTTQRYISPTGEVTAAVRQLETATIDLRRRAGAYSLLASIPLKGIGLKLSPGQDLRGDLGVVYAAPNGIDTQLRSFWANRKGGLTDDLAGEAGLDSAQWGTFRLP